MSNHRMNNVRWVDSFDATTKSASFSFSDDKLDSLAASHYVQGRQITGSPGDKEFAKYVHLDYTRTDLSISQHPDSGDFIYHASLRQPVPLRALAQATQYLLQTDPHLHPIVKGIEAFDRTHKGRLHKNQRDLLNNFPDYILRNDSVLAIDKPANVSTRWDRINHVGALEIGQVWEEDLRIIHRLDRPTSGVLLFGKTATAQRHIGSQFEHKEQSGLEKTYIAKIDGDFGDDRSVRCFIDTKERPVTVGVDSQAGKIARTTFEKILTFQNLDGKEQSLLCIRPIDGRTHQIRASLAAIGMPIVNDTRYGGSRENGRLQLHALSLKLNHPDKDELISLHAPMPDDFFSNLTAKTQWNIKRKLSRITSQL